MIKKQIIPETNNNLVAFNTYNSLINNENTIYLVSIHHYEVSENESLSVDNAYIVTPDSDKIEFSNLVGFMNLRDARNRMFTFKPTLFESMQWFEKVYVVGVPTIIYLHNSYINYTPEMHPLFENFWMAKFQ